MRVKLSGLLAIGAWLVASTPASANIILLGQSPQGGAGFGSVLNILTLQNNVTEIGKIAPPDVESGDAMPTSTFRTFAALATIGITSGSDFGIVYNVNQQGVQLNTQLNSFSVDVYSSSNTFLQSFTYTGPACNITTGVGCFAPIGQNGTGTAGYLFGFDAAQAAQFTALLMANPLGGVGMSGNISFSNDGPENFFAVDLNAPGDPVPVPEPGSLMLFGTGMMLLGRKVRRRFQSTKG